jgi:hypothetical protein
LAILEIAREAILNSVAILLFPLDLTIDASAGRADKCFIVHLKSLHIRNEIILRRFRTDVELPELL